MKDFEVEFEEWWEVTKEYLIKKLEKNLVWHKINEIFLKYKLEAYQKNFQDFIYGNSTSTKVSGQDEEIKAGPSGIVEEEEIHIKEPQDFISGGT
jgi:hypothetical protein